MRNISLVAVIVGCCMSTVCPGQTTRPAVDWKKFLSEPGPATQATAPSTQPAFASTTRPVPTTLPSLDAVLTRLGSDSWQTRQAAVDELARMGEDARPIIHDLLGRNSLDAETSTRLEAAISQIDDNRISGPSFISLHLVDASPKQVFAELSRQSYTELKAWPENLLDLPELPRVSLDIDRKPFWEAMKVISEKTGIDLQQFNDGLRLMRGGFHPNSPFSAVEGPFLIQATQITRTQTIVLAGNANMSDFSIQIQVFSEPKLHVLSSSSAIHLDEVVDDAGNPLIPATVTNRGFYGGGGGCWNLMAELKFPDNPGKKITRFKGSGSFVIQTKSQQVEIPDLKNLKDVTRVIADIPVVFHDLKKNGTVWELHFSANPQSVDPARWAQFQHSMQTNLELLDSKGHTLDHRGMSSTGNNEGFDCNLRYSPSRRADGALTGDPDKLIWEFPTASKEIRVPLEFNNLPMPK